MNFFATLTQQLSNVLGSQDAGRRASFYIVLLLSVGGLGYLGMRAKVGNFRVLYSNLSTSDAGLAAVKLRQLDIPVRIEDGGTTLEVPSRHWDDAVMILVQEGFPNSGVLGYELMDKSSLGLSKFEQEIRFHRSLEGELARTIMAFNSIERAKVHLSMPDDSSFFQDENTGPSASVIVKTRGGKALTVKEAGGIARLVASAVDGMEPTSISIVDSRGIIIDQGADASVDTMAVGGRMAFKVDYENRLKDLIETMLARTVGEGKVVARVNADFNFAQKTEKLEIYDPESQVIRQENWTGEGANAAAAASSAGGVAGSGANLPNSGGAQTSSVGGGGGRTGKFDRSTIYELSRTTSVIEETVPQLKRITASVFVDGIYPLNEETGEPGAYEPRSPTELAAIEDAIMGVIGFVKDRGNGVGDTVGVNSMEFRLPDFDLDDNKPLADKLLTPSLIREVIQWAVFGIIGILLIFLVLRPAVKGMSGVAVAVAPARANALPSAARAPAALSGAAPAPASAMAELTAGMEAEEGEEYYDDDDDDSSLTPSARQLAKLRKSGKAQAALAEATTANLQKASGIVRGWIDDK